METKKPEQIIAELEAERDALRAQLTVSSKALTDAGAEIEELKNQLSAAKEREAALPGTEDYPPSFKKLVREKRAAGLDLPTAIAAAKNQVAWDEQQRKDAAKEAKSGK